MGSLSRLRPRKVIGLVSSNDMGMTTLRAFATLLNKDDGRMAIVGHSLGGGSEAIRRTIQHLPENAGVEESINGR